jgi:hypothetical protein
MADPGENAPLEARVEYAKFNLQRRQTERAAQTPQPPASDTTEEMYPQQQQPPTTAPQSAVASVARRPQDQLAQQAPAMAQSSRYSQWSHSSRRSRAA